MKNVFIAMMIFLMPAASAFAQRPDANNPPVIVVTGESSLRVSPDEATVRLGIMRQAPSAQAAQDQTNTAAGEILAAIGKVGIASADIQTSRLSLNPVYAPRPDNNQAPRIAAYQASNIVTVRLVDLAKVGPVVDAGLKAGANEIQGVQFSLRDDLAARQQALKQAVIEARKKAEAMADALNVRLGNPIEVTDNGVSFVPRDNFNGTMMMQPRAAEIAPTPVSAGQLEIRANVTIRYLIAGLPKP